MFGWEYPPHYSGGLGIACQGLVRGLLAEGARVTLVLPGAADIPDGVETCPTLGERLTITAVPAGFKAYEGCVGYQERIASSPQLRDLYGPDLGSAVQRFAEESVERTAHLHPDLIHCHDWMTFDAGLRAAAHHHVPLVLHVHATELDRTNFQPDPWIFEREREGLLRADHVIAVSHYTKDILVKHYGIPGDRITVVHNGHTLQGSEDTAAVHRDERAPIVLFLGRLTIQKNPLQFLEVARAVHQLRPDVQFVMAGDGPMLPELMERASAWGLTGCMVFPGKVQGEEVDSLYRHASCFVMPSLSEPFGLVALEAIGHGVPVVLSKQSGAAEVVDHGFKVDFWDTEKFADCILTILREEPLARQLSLQAITVLKRLTWDHQAREVLSAYGKILSPSAPKIA